MGFAPKPPGQMRWQITLFRDTSVKTETNTTPILSDTGAVLGLDDAARFVKYRTAMCYYSPIAGTESTTGGEIQGTQRAEFVIRHNKNNDISVSDRIRFRGQDYDIQEVSFDGVWNQFQYIKALARNVK